ncbi:ABC transporter ATP-binding protein [Anoxynatronum buryatiense]|uniref:Amino acid/amide ABC transporter ATP-binding protein 1, HAAT family n=1 Tax=Anoxynatronum buryatiense TaxID=489973 RepID=A0AA45WXI7_9CLOT|nr:ABC transporter ATP-binding protein [Anoxynatronum buryatiense]SMP64863.1 amino acid/amide ABC transporter ATP-binding protein 1, HAAT family [Anoxynatronum buryatiense]
MSLLKTNAITMQFGGLTAVNELSLAIDKGEIVAVIGPNGAGKTTAFNMITGVYKPTKGNIQFNDQDITGLKPHLITKQGMARTFQNIRLFKDLSVEDNIFIAQHLHLKANLYQAMFRLPGYQKEEKLILEKVFFLLEKVGLADLSREKASSLPYGLQRKLEIARALATDPQLLLLDEPAAGMNPKETEDLTRFIRQIRDEFDLTILLIEHHMQVVMDISNRIYVLDYGVTIAEGTPVEIQNNERVIQAYLGVDEDA